MSDQRPQQEPSMEEILASIRRIISEDGSRSDDAAPESADKATEAAAGEEALLLTEMVAEDGMVVDLAAKDASALPDPPSAAAETAPAPTAAPPPAEAAATAGAKELVSPPVAATAAQSFAALSRAIERERSFPLGGGRMVEDLVREALEPMLRQWLDAHLAAIVERLIRQEIERIARRGEDTGG